MGGELIRVVQLPVIEEQLRTMKGSVEARVSAAMALVCTEETIQSVKAERAAIRKEFDALETNWKAVKSAVLAPLNRAEETYKECVTEPYKRADADLKRKVSEVENEIKGRCEAELREYFSELCAANHVEWLAFERTGVVVDLTSTKQKTPRKLQNQLLEFVTVVANSVSTIATLDDSEEIMVEYKRSLNLPDAIRTVKDRNARVEAERAAAAARAVAVAAEQVAVQKVEAVAPPVEPVKVYTCTFTVQATKSQLLKLKDFLNMEGIKYE